MAIGVQQCSIVATVVSSGAVVVRVAYHAYGQPMFTNAAGTTLSAKATRYSYKGRAWDSAINLGHNGKGFFDSSLWCFVGRVIGGSATPALGLYTVLGNSPVNSAKFSNDFDIFPLLPIPGAWDVLQSIVEVHVERGGDPSS